MMRQRVKAAHKGGFTKPTGFDHSKFIYRRTQPWITKHQVRGDDLKNDIF